MGIYIISPSLTMEDPEKTKTFISSLEEQFCKYDISYTVISSPVKYMHKIKKEDIALIFNDEKAPLDKSLNDLLEKLKQTGTSIYPIAWNTAGRTPAKIISTYQSFDIAEQLRRRDLTGDHMAVIAQVGGPSGLRKTT